MKWGFIKQKIPINGDFFVSKYPIPLHRINSNNMSQSSAFCFFLSGNFLIHPISFLFPKDGHTPAGVRNFRTRIRNFRAWVRNFRAWVRNFRTRVRNFRTRERNFRTRERNFRTREQNFRTRERNFRTRERNLRTRERNLQALIFSF
jgi:hypothetical protein